METFGNTDEEKGKKWQMIAKNNKKNGKKFFEWKRPGNNPHMFE